MTAPIILAAFWNRHQCRFCELVAGEIKSRSGFDVTTPEVKALICRGMIKADIRKQGGMSTIYSLTRDGEAAVSAMIVMGKLPKPAYRLTAIPPDPNRWRK